MKSRPETTRSTRPGLRILAVLWVVFAVTSLATTAAAASSPRTLYVDANSGSDYRTVAAAQEPSKAWRSLARAFEVADPGDQIVVADGAYTLELLDLQFDPPVTIVGSEASTLFLDVEGTKGLTVIGFSYPEPTFVTESQDITFVGGNSEGGFDIGQSIRVTFERMEIHNVDDPERAPFEKAIGIGRSAGLVIRNSWFHSNPEDAIQAAWVDGIEIVGNIFDDNGPWNATVDLERDRHSDVFQVLAGTDILFSDNRVTNNRHVLMIKNDFDPIERVTIENNFFGSNDGYAMQLIGVNDAVVRSNVYDCNGLLWEPCTEGDQFAVRETDTVNVLFDQDGEPGDNNGLIPETPEALFAESDALGPGETTTTLATSTPTEVATPTSVGVVEPGTESADGAIVRILLGVGLLAILIVVIVKSRHRRSGA